MATSGILLRLLVLLGLIAGAVNARSIRHFHPCKTLILISISPSFVDRNPDFSLRNPLFHRSVIFYIAKFHKIEPETTYFLPRIVNHDEKNCEFYSCANTPFCHRFKDILSIVRSLLFGVGCGALTAANLFLVWSLFAYNHYEEESDCDFGSDKFDGDANPKKMGYLAIPAVEAPSSAPPVKEVLRELRSASIGAFQKEYGQWVEEQNRRVSKLRTALNSQMADTELCILVDGSMKHYSELVKSNP